MTDFKAVMADAEELLSATANQAGEKVTAARGRVQEKLRLAREEFAAGHLPYGRSLPLPELKRRLNELPKNKPVVAYCRGPFCMMAKDAVALLQKRGYQAFRLDDGVAEWRTRGLPVEQ